MCAPPPLHQLQVSKNMMSITKTLEKTLESNNLEKIQETMNKFEKQFEDLDLQTQVMDGVMATQANLTTPEDEVNSLMEQVRRAGTRGPATSGPAKDLGEMMAQPRLHGDLTRSSRPDLPILNPETHLRGLRVG
jgi:hypothetical protein